MKFSLITPEKTVWQGEITAVTLPTANGYIQVLPHHVPLISVLVAGEVRVQQEKGEFILAVSDGFIEVRPNNEVVVLAATAERAEEIDVDRAEAARERARKLLTEKITDQTEYATLTAVLEREFARLKVARKHRSHVSPLGAGVTRKVSN